MRDAWGRVALWVALTATVGAAGCGGGGGAAGGAGTTATGGAGTTGSAGTNGGTADGGRTDGATTAVADPKFAPFCVAARAEMINIYDRCAGFAPEAAKALVPRDPCVWWGAAINGNRMAFDATYADACIAALKTLSCDTDQTPAICDRALVGVQKLGAVCSRAAELLYFSECGPGDACVVGANPCEGKCVARALLTKPCSLDVPCLQGEVCDLLGSGTCKLRLGMGDACGLGSGACDSGLTCSDIFAGGTCVPRKGMGGECNTGLADCQPPLSCKAGATIDDPGTCQVTPRPGTACDPASFTFTCSRGLLTCGDDMKCRVEPGLGQPCETADGDLITCGSGYCENKVTPAVCKAWPAGSPCRVEQDCAPNALCAAANFQAPKCTEVCVPR